MNPIKDYCGWCLIPLDPDEERYEREGNICFRCSARCASVVHGEKTPEDADMELRMVRIKNLQVYNTLEKRNKQTTLLDNYDRK